MVWYPCCSCDRLPFSDTFSTIKRGWNLTTISITGGVITVPDVATTGGQGWRCARAPTGSGWVLTLQVDIDALADPGTFGECESILRLRNGNNLTTGAQIAELKAYNNAGTTGYRAFYPSSSTDLSTSWSSGDTAKITITENSGSYDMRFYVNGTLKHTASGESISGGLDSNISYGVRGRESQSPTQNTTGACTFDDISISVA